MYLPTYLPVYIHTCIIKYYGMCETQRAPVTSVGTNKQICAKLQVTGTTT